MHTWKYLAILVTLAALCLGQAPQPPSVFQTRATPEATYLQVDRPGYSTTFLMGIAANGRIAGFASHDQAVNSAPSQYLRSTGFLLEAGRFSDLAHPDPSNPARPHSTFPMKIRANGTVAGWNTPATGPAADETGWVWRNGHFQDVVYLGPEYADLDPEIDYWKITDVMSTNGRGDMVGQAGWINPADTTAAGSHWRGWLSLKGSFQLIDPPGSTLTYPADINERGEVVGLYRTPDSRKGFLRSAEGRPKDIVMPAPAQGGSVFLTFPQAINNSGDIVGFYALVPGLPRGFLLSRGVYTRIDVPGSLDTVVYGIDETGVMVGTFKDEQGVHGFIRIPR